MRRCNIFVEAAGIARQVVALAMFLMALSCGTKNYTEKYGALTSDEKIRIAIDDKDFSQARTLLEKAIAEDPLTYDRYVLLAAVYAQLAEFDLFAAASSSGSESGQNAFDLVGEFIPGEITSERLELMESAIAIIAAIPEDKRRDGSEEPYAASAVFQGMLYQAAYSVMVLRQFYDVATGLPDPEALASMTDEQASVILDGLLAAAANAPTGDQGEAFASSLERTVAAVDARPGENRAEKLRGYVAR